MVRTSIASVGVFSAFVALFSCSGRSRSSDDGGGESNAGDGGTSGTASGGTSGSAGTSTGGTGASPTGGSNMGGSAGTAARSGAGGTMMPNGGVAGAAPNGGSAGSPSGGTGAGGGTGGGGQECETAEDCTMFSDCCNCMALPKGEMPPQCDLVCITDQCTALQIEREEVTCNAFGRCVIDRSCNIGETLCPADPEPCPDGEERSIVDDCFGACIPATECRTVADCAACDDAVCVISGAWAGGTGCVVPEPSCTKGNYCECLDACTIGSCIETEDAVECPCPFC